MFTKSTNPDFILPEIIEEILTRLPVKSLLRFRCVSKSWLSLISSPRFIRSHLNISSNLPRVMLNSILQPVVSTSIEHSMKHYSINSLINPETEEAIDIQDYPGKETGSTVWVIGSCNGLICLYADLNDLFIWNPCTRKYLELPCFELENKITGFKSISNEFSYSAVDDDYKVLRLFIMPGTLEVYIYSWRSNSWKYRVFSYSGITRVSEHKFLAGKIHIVTTCPGAIGFDIVTFDLENEVHGTIEQPDYGKGVIKGLILEEIGGWFCVVCRKETHTDLWVMKEYGVKESWTKILTVSFLDEPFKAWYVNPLIMLPSGEVLVAREFYELKSCFEVYNIKDNRRVLKRTNFGDFLTTDVYVESLISPNQHVRMGIQEEQ